ncbi:helix-turn-helix domain-containing protein [Viridibacillus arvi]|uniref:helix-turn-helix domain-containing protein n=1 Tax=Viridibacillus arvi TaxID=263475 RepID=UPI0034CDF872
MTAETNNTKQQYTLYEMRQKSKKSDYAVARLCGTTTHTLRNWEIGELKPNVLQINNLLQIYGYSFSELNLQPFYVAHQDNEVMDDEQDIDEAIELYKSKRRLKRLLIIGILLTPPIVVLLNDLLGPYLENILTKLFS